MRKSFVCIGFSYSARALLPHLLDRGWDVSASSRTEAGLSEITRQGVTPLAFPSNALSDAVRAAQAVLVSAAPDDDGDPTLRALRPDIHAADALQWVGYLSTTGVYGDHDGGWVDETTPLTPSTRRGEARVTAEAAWQALARETNMPLHIFRLAGIYGPGRGPFAKVRAGTARRIIKPGQVFSRIHVDDIAQVLLASLDAPRPGAIYNVCDDDPAPPQDVIAEAARLLGLPVPPDTPIEDADLSPMAKSFYAESKRVRNDLIKEELGVRLLYPDFRAGLSAQYS